MLQELESYACEARSRAFASGEDEQSGVGVEFLDGHLDAVFAVDDVGEEIRVVGFGGEAAVDFADVEVEDFVLAGLHGFGDHHTDDFVEGGSLLAFFFIGHKFP